MENGHSGSQDLWDQQQRPRGFALADAPRLLSTACPVSLTPIPRREKEKIRVCAKGCERKPKHCPGRLEHAIVVSNISIPIDGQVRAKEAFRLLSTPHGAREETTSRRTALVAAAPNVEHLVQWRSDRRVITAKAKATQSHSKSKQFRLRMLVSVKD